jgi:protein-tyrosine-phosphatase
MTDSQTTVLFVCTGNINRSAAAHVILDNHNPGKYKVKSCGTGKVAPMSRKIPRKMLLALEELGYDGSNHRSQGICESLLQWADVIVCMGNVHEKYVGTHYPEHSHKVSNWLIDDPHFATGMDKHREVAKQIQEQVYLQFA